MIGTRCFIGSALDNALVAQEAHEEEVGNTAIDGGHVSPKVGV
jgi:hypothetical protein